MTLCLHQGLLVPLISTQESLQFLLYVDPGLFGHSHHVLDLVTIVMVLEALDTQWLKAATS